MVVDECPANGPTVRGVFVACLTTMQEDVLNRSLKSGKIENGSIGEMNGSSDN